MKRRRLEQRMNIILKKTYDMLHVTISKATGRRMKVECKDKEDSPSQYKEVGLWLIGNNHHDWNANETNQHTCCKRLCNVF